MNEAVFKFRATGDVDINSLWIDYGDVTPSEEWCHTPYVVSVDDPQGNLYELRVPLSPFNRLENGSSRRTCTLRGPIYVYPKLSTPIINVDLEIEQIACIDKLNCEELLNNIRVYVNSDSDHVTADGGVVEIGRENWEEYFTEQTSPIVNGDGTPCTWARYDSDGNVIVSRRYFDDYSEGVRTAIATYIYRFSSDEEIDNTSCSGTFIGNIYQFPRECSEADVRLVERYTDFPSTGETRSLTNIAMLDGEDASAYEILDKSDIRVSGPAFNNCLDGSVNCPDIVQYSALYGYLIKTATNRDENTNLLEDKIGTIKITYHNKYIDGCTFTDEVEIRVKGLTCEELLGRVYLGIKVNGSEEVVRGGNIQISSEETRFTVYILGDRYAEYFDIDENSCTIPPSVNIDGYDFIIPENEDPYLTRVFDFKFVAGIINEEYSGYSAYGCSMSQEFTFTQSPYQSIEHIGDRSEKDFVECERIESIPELTIEAHSTCDEISGVQVDEVVIERECEQTITPITVTSHENIQSCDFIDDMYRGDIDVDCE